MEYVWILDCWWDKTRHLKMSAWTLMMTKQLEKKYDYLLKLIVFKLYFHYINHSVYH